MKLKKYWVAECTPGFNWRVGDQPQNLLDVKPKIIAINSSKTSQGIHVFSSLDKLPSETSFISITISQDALMGEEKGFIVSGAISPLHTDVQVALYLSQDGSSWNLLKQALTKFGNYSFKLMLNSTGTYYIRTSWSGFGDCIGADSETLIVFVKLPNPPINFELPKIEELPKDPVQRAQYAAIFHILTKVYNITSERALERFIRIGGPSLNTALSSYFAIFKEGGGKTDSEFGFLIKCSSCDRSINVVGIQEAFKIVRELNGIEQVLVKLPIDLKEKEWYRISVKVYDGQVIAEFSDGDGVPRKMTVEEEFEDIAEYGIWIRCSENVTLALKNLKIEEPHQNIAMGQNVGKPPLGIDRNLMTIIIIIMALSFLFHLTAVIQIRRLKISFLTASQ